MQQGREASACLATFGSLRILLSLFYSARHRVSFVAWVAGAWRFAVLWKSIRGPVLHGVIQRAACVAMQPNKVF
jgi:hypothetical protein